MIKAKPNILIIIKMINKVIINNNEGTVTNPAILLVINAVRIFPFLPTGTVSLKRAADYISSFVAIFHKLISSCRQY